jgi:hypothetical protein
MKTSKRFLPMMAVAFLTTVIILGSFSRLKAGGFKLVKQDKVLSLYERWICGDKGNKVRELKCVFTVESDITSITRLLTDQSRGTQWNSNTLRYKILRTGNAATWTAYIRYDIPWPFNDQDCCLLYHFKRLAMDADAQGAVITFKSISDPRFSIAEETDRITGIRGKWLLEPRGKGQTKITYLITTERSQNIPRWISDPIIHNNLFSTMTKFKDMLENNA